MFDNFANNILNKKLEYISHYIPKSFSANTITIAGFVIGLLAVPLISYRYYFFGLLLIIINRLFDGLDGAIARKKGITSLGGYLDITCDFIFYSAIIFGFALADSEKNSFAAIFILFSFVGTGTSFLAFAAIEKSYDLYTSERGKKSFFYFRGLIEGSETILFYIIVCLFPYYFPIIAIIFGIFCWITVIGRIISAYYILR